LRRLAANVVDPAAPLLFSPIPGKILAHSAIVWIDRSCRGWRRCGWRQGWRDGTRGWRRLRRRRGGRRRGRRRREWRGWDCRRCLWQGCGRATPADGHAAIVLLPLRPHPLDHHIVGPPEVASEASEVASRAHTSAAIVRQRRRRSRQEPEQQGDEQKTQKTATCDDASEIPPRTPKISSIAHILVCGLQRVAALTRAHVGQSAIASATPTSDTTSSAVLPRSNTASSSTAVRAVGAPTKSASTAEATNAAASISTAKTASSSHPTG